MDELLDADCGELAAAAQGALSHAVEAAAGGGRRGTRDGGTGRGGRPLRVLGDEGGAAGEVEVAAEIDGVVDKGVRAVLGVWGGVFEEKLQAYRVVGFQDCKGSVMDVGMWTERLTLPADSEQHRAADEVNELERGVHGEYRVPEHEKLVEWEFSAEEQTYPAASTVSEILKKTADFLHEEYLGQDFYVGEMGGEIGIDLVEQNFVDVLAPLYNRRARFLKRLDTWRGILDLVKVLRALHELRK